MELLGRCAAHDGGFVGGARFKGHG
jgi:hypothetical protein